MTSSIPTAVGSDEEQPAHHNDAASAATAAVAAPVAAPVAALVAASAAAMERRTVSTWT